MNTPPPPRPGDYAIEHLLESLRQKVTPPPAAPAEEDDLPLLTDIVHSEYPSRLRPHAAPPPPVPPPQPAPPPEEKEEEEKSPAPPAQENLDARIAARAAEAERQALARIEEELPRLIAAALHNALPGITAEILKGIKEEKTED
ncbi:MAG: hypothetical protein LBC37_07995 [Zoogloeaceae bacterium]|jgi:hypothetical protein|nr:hypothetical protein [Zoogloeaceae bacterium]